MIRYRLALMTSDPVPVVTWDRVWNFLAIELGAENLMIFPGEEPHVGEARFRLPRPVDPETLTAAVAALPLIATCRLYGMATDQPVGAFLRAGWAGVPV